MAHPQNTSFTDRAWVVRAGVVGGWVVAAGLVDAGWLGSWYGCDILYDLCPVFLLRVTKKDYILIK